MIYLFVASVTFVMQSVPQVFPIHSLPEGLRGRNETHLSKRSNLRGKKLKIAKHCQKNIAKNNIRESAIFQKYGQCRYYPYLHNYI